MELDEEKPLWDLMHRLGPQLIKLGETLKDTEDLEAVKLVGSALEDAKNAIDRHISTIVFTRSLKHMDN